MLEGSSSGGTAGEDQRGGAEASAADQAKGRRVAAVRATPETDAGRVDVGASAQVEPCPLHVVPLARPARAIAQGLPKLHSVADSAPVIDREHDETAARQELIEGIGVVVVLQVVPAEEHLAHRAAMEED